MGDDIYAKKWGNGEFWGLSSLYDADWVLTESQKNLREKLMELCRVKIRPHAIHCDRTYEYPRESMNALSELGLLGLIVPKELGGLGESHVCAAMVVETIARYGCPSTAMVYTMHVGACTSILFRHHESKIIQDLLKRLDKDKLIGTLSYSDPASGGHFWFPLSSKVKKVNSDLFQVLKYGSWATSAGFADWYTIQTVSPDCTVSDTTLCCFLVFKDEVRASSDDWSALGMHGNQSGPLIVEGKFPKDRMIGPVGDGYQSNNECVAPFFMMLTSACWNGISLGCLDVAKKHVTRKAHADVAMRICDYPTIQDYFGDCVASTCVSRSHVNMLATQLDKVTNNNDWSLHKDLNFSARSYYHQWLWIAKYFAAKNVNDVGDVMLHACGGSGYKTDLGLERLVRDGKAGWLMAPSNEALRQFLGKAALTGVDSIDIWENKCNQRVIHHEVGKMSLSEKKDLAVRLQEEVKQEESGVSINHPHQDTDFENPFNTEKPKYVDMGIKGDASIVHEPGLHPDNWKSLKLRSKYDSGKNLTTFVFDLPSDSNHMSCLPGQYVKVRVWVNEKSHERYLSPVSDPVHYGKIEVVLRFENHGIVSKYFKELKPGDQVEFIGPCGGFEYKSSVLDELTLIASGCGITPGMQLIRSVANNSSDKTRVTVLYYSENAAEILYKDELDKYAKHDDRFRIFYSVGEVPEDWAGREGFIDTKMISETVSKVNGLKHKIVMCGGPTMVISCLHSLKALKYPSEMIFIYGPFGTQQIRTVYGKKAKLSGHKLT